MRELFALRCLTALPGVDAIHDLHALKERFGIGYTTVHLEIGGGDCHLVAGDVV